MGTRSALSTGHPLHPVISICRGYVRETLGLVRTISFWTAVTLPWVLLAFLLGGLALDHPVVFTVLLATNLVTGIIGHNHGE